MADEAEAPAQGNTEAAAEGNTEGQQDTTATLPDKAAAAAPAKPADKPAPAKPAAPAKAPAADKAAPAPNKEAKPADKQAPAAPAAAPEKYELALPEDSKLQADDVDKIESFAKEHGLSQDAAQALLEHESAIAAARDQAQLDHLKAQSEAWREEVLNDKEMGGEKAAENIELAHRFAKTYWDDDFIAELDKTGLGNHPGLMKGFYRAGKAMAPDKIRGSGQPGAKKKSTEEVLYGKQE